MICCKQGKRRSDPTPTPENAIPIAKPRLQTNQWGEKSERPTYVIDTLPPTTYQPELLLT
jgi:hypothetical protein